jgi:hypothetical protein
MRPSAANTKGLSTGSLTAAYRLWDMIWSLKSEATEEKPSGLYINPRLAAIVRRAFRMYATGKYSDLAIAEWMNLRPAIQKLREGKQPIGKETIRDLLQNRIYTGYVPYAETRYAGSLGQGKRSNRYRKEWFEGKHQGFISDELYTVCQEVRQDLRRIRRPLKLSGLIFCMIVYSVCAVPHKNRPSWQIRTMAKCVPVGILNEELAGIAVWLATAVITVANNH